MRYWLARFSFSFLIIGCVLFWEAFQNAQGNAGPISGPRIVLYGLGAGACCLLGLAGIRLRHRQ
jgi:hypothetical protein